MSTFTCVTGPDCTLGAVVHDLWPDGWGALNGGEELTNGFVDVVPTGVEGIWEWCHIEAKDASYVIDPTRCLALVYTASEDTKEGKDSDTASAPQEVVIRMQGFLGDSDLGLVGNWKG